MAAHLLADVGLGSGASGCVAWCPVNGIVAVGCRVRPDLACVHLLNVHCVSRKVTLYVPLQGPADDLVAVAWSPAGCRRVLLTATLCGKLTAWTQQPPEPSSQARITVEDWWCHDVADLAAAPAPAAAAAAVGQAGTGSSSHLVAVRWLQPAPSWVWTSSTVQQADYQSGSIHGMFSQPSLAGANSKRDPIGTEDAAAGAEGSGAAGDQPGCSNGSRSEDFHWVRTGTLALTAVMSCGAVVLAWAQWSAYAQLSWVRTSGMVLPTPAGAAGQVQVAAADATVCAEGVVVAYTLQQQPSTVCVAQVQGNPLHVQCAMLEPGSQPLQLPVVQVGSHSLEPPGCCVTALSWDQCSDGGRLASVARQHSSTHGSGNGAAADTAAAGGGSGALLTLHRVQRGQLLLEAQVPYAAAVTQQQLVWLVDGLLLWSGGHSMQLLTLDQLQQVAVSFASPAGRFRAAGAAATGSPGSSSSSSGRWLCGLAASPHGVAVAAVMQCPSAARGTSSSRLLLYNVPPAGTAAEGDSSGNGFAAPKPVAARLLWALMQQKHTWDVVQHALCAARRPTSSSSNGVGGADAGGAAASVLPEAVGQVLSLVDSKLAVQQPTLKSTFSARWDVLKLAVLSGTPGDVARVVSIDLRLRIISHMMKPVFDVMREDASMRQRESRPRLTGLAPLHTYLADLMAFHIACLKTWVTRRAGSSGGLPQHVPCIRHFLDWRPCNLLLLLYMITCTAVSQPTSSKSDDVLYPTLKQAFKAAAACKDTAWEQTARGLFPGELQLHYSDTIPECLSGLCLPPDKMMAHMDSSALWKQQQPLSDAEITATATRLGLLPVRPPKAAGMYRRELQLHGGFRLQLDPAAAAAADLPFAAAAAATAAAGQAVAAVQATPVPDGTQVGLPGRRLVSMKRRHWEQQIGDAMGDTLGPGGGSGCGSGSIIISFAQLADMDAAMPGSLLSVDGAVLAAEGPAPLAIDDGSKTVPKLIVDQCANGWMYACPITGEMWICGS